jgi:hypothetical protein
VPIEYSIGRWKRKAAAARRAKKAIPAAGPVTVIQADGKRKTLPPVTKGVIDRPYRRR